MLRIQDSPYIKTFHYDNADSFLKAISHKGELYELFNDNFIFRGHSTEEYDLLPSALRVFLSIENEKIDKTISEEYKKDYYHLATTELAQIQYEYKLLQEFFQICDINGLYVPHIETLRNSFLPGVDVQILLLKQKWIPKAYWELAALAQHHGVKTRLLDWSHDVHVALYFATTGVYMGEKDFFDFRKYLEASKKGLDYPPKHNMELWALDENVLMAEPAIMPLRIVQPRYHDNLNLCAQKGVFTFWESVSPGLYAGNGKPDFKTQTDRRTLDILLDSYLKKIKSPEKIYLYQITISKECAYDIYCYIEKLGYNASTLFPGYNGVAKYMEEHMLIHRKGSDIY